MCKGTNEWLHLECLRTWQKTVVMEQPTHPKYHTKIDQVCNVCLEPFTGVGEAPDREAMMVRVHTFMYQPLTFLYQLSTFMYHSEMTDSPFPLSCAFIVLSFSLIPPNVPSPFILQVSYTGAELAASVAPGNLLVTSRDSSREKLELMAKVQSSQTLSKSVLHRQSPAFGSRF